MYELAKKRVLLAGNEVGLMSDLTSVFEKDEAVVSQARCVVAADYDALHTNDFDLIVITQLYDPGTHKAFLKRCNTPILTLIDLQSDDVQEVLSFGAGDFIDVADSAESIIEKASQLLEQKNYTGTHAEIDLTRHQQPIKATDVRVFIVEDDPLLRNLLKARFDQSNYKSEFSENGTAIIERVAKFNPDILILDLMLPGKNGFDILKELKADAETKPIPVFVFSNRDSQNDRQRAKQLGAVSFYVKAMTDLSELVTLIDDYVSQSKL